MLIKNNNKWLIFDILLNGSISEIATKKSEFKETLSNGGINSLISLISKKLKI
jgi:ABC-type transporter MlaC component